ncbi:unnamed protein product [Trifolium pratense]|uniref:Uncharacterized protein n=1 Tax=Trifolium pratense TaxID=57577 RepID=A0ACB0JXS9_TRIPR|nr:unnamed protein product [Trifolium pratense]
MVKTIKFVYVVLLFLSLLLVIKNVDALRCDTDDDCPKIRKPDVHYIWRCIDNMCNLSKEPATVDKN